MFDRVTVPHRLFPLFLIGFSLLASGCQTLNGLFGQEPQPVVVVPEIKPTFNSASSHVFKLAPEQDIVGQLATVDSRENDTLSDVARHFGLGFNDITIANAGIQPWTPTAGSRVLLPMQFILPDAPRKGIVLNLANMRLFYFPKKEAGTLYTYPIGIGRDGWNTPMGLTSIAQKTANPEWHVPASIHREHALKGDRLPSVVRSGPDNPLGLYAMRMAIPGYLIHGTNKPYGIGMQISHGCVQMYPEDIEVLFKNASVGLPVRIVHQPYLFAWNQDMLYLEAHEPLSKWAGSKKQLQKQLLKQLRKTGAKKGKTIDWQKVDNVLLRADGIPTPILANSPGIEQLTANAQEFAHPGSFYGQPTVAELSENDWSLRVASFDSEIEAKQLSAMLNHQGPPIPARPLRKNERYEVIAGPYKSQKEVKKAAKRILMDFELTTEPLAPGLLSANP